MGRYDKLALFNSTQVPIKRLYAQGTNANRAENLIDFGSFDSDNTTTLMVYTELNLWERVTLNKQVTIIPGSKYTTGSFSLLPASGYCCCTKASGSYAKSTWYFKTKLKRTAFTTNANVFRCGSSSNTEVKITWNSNGKFVFKRAWGGTGGTSTTYTTPDAFSDVDTIYEVSFQIDNGTNTLKVSIKNTTTDVTTSYTHNLGGGSNFIISNATNTVGSAEVELLDYLQVQGVQWKNSTNKRDIDLDTATQGSTTYYTNLQIVEEPDTEIVNWV